MISALKFLVQFLSGEVLTACESKNAQDRPMKNVRTRTRVT